MIDRELCTIYNDKNFYKTYASSFEKREESDMKDTMFRFYSSAISAFAATAACCAYTVAMMDTMNVVSIFAALILLSVLGLILILVSVYGNLIYPTAKQPA